jgi:hypothetical protein
VIILLNLLVPSPIKEIVVALIEFNKEQQEIIIDEAFKFALYTSYEEMYKRNFYKKTIKALGLVEDKEDTVAESIYKFMSEKSKYDQSEY